MYNYSHQPLFRCFLLDLAPQLGSYIFNCVPACVSVQSCPALCDPMDCSLPGFSVHGISQQEYWSGLLFLQGILQTQMEAMSPAPAGRFFITVPPGKPLASNYLHFIFS